MIRLIQKALRNILNVTSRRKFLAGAYLVALAIRLLFVIVKGSPTEPTWQEHTNIAHNLYTGHGYSMHWGYISLLPERRLIQHQPPTFEGSFQPPLNPYLIYGFFSIFGEIPSTIYLIMVFYSIVGALLPVLVYKTALEITDERRARIAAIIAVLFLPAAYSVISLSGSPLYIVAALAFLYFCLQIRRDPGQIINYIGAGILGGLTGLLRSEFFIVGIVILFVTIISLTKTPGFAQALKYILITLAIHSSICSIWIVRNYNLYGHILPSGTHSWHEIWRGNNPYASGLTFNSSGDMVIIDTTRFRQITMRVDSIPYDKHFEYHIDQVFREEALAYVKAHPMETVWRTLQKVFFLFTFDFSHELGGNIFYSGSMLLVSILTVAAFILMIKKMRFSLIHSPFSILLTFLAIYTLQIGISEMLPRYQIYVFSVMLPLTGIGLNGLLEMFHRSERKRQLGTK
jgi:4-amino-4-deoxy-L-arabinose transferase-like glycosyltransferase